MKKGIFSVKSMVLMAIMAAVMCVLAQVSVPIGVVPITLATFAIYLCLFVLDMKRSTIAVVVYILLGVVGLPVYAGFSGGIGKVMGPTGGYIIGYIFLALIGGLFVDKFDTYEKTGKDYWVNVVINFVGMVLATAVLYVFGTAWFCIQASYSVGAALGICVFPFIPGDLAKIVVAIIAGSQIRKALNKAKLRNF